MNDLAEEFGLIVAYPHQTRRANPSGCWNWFDRRHQNRGSGEPAKLAGLAQALAKEFDVRRERIFAAGLSAGGAMAEILAVTYPDVFDAVGIHSGLPYKSAGDVPSAFAAMKGTAAFDPAPLAASDRHCRKIIFHGLADGTVNPVNGERIFDEVERGENSLARSDLDWQIEGGRLSRTALKDADGQTGGGAMAGRRRRARLVRRRSARQLHASRRPRRLPRHGALFLGAMKGDDGSLSGSADPHARSGTGRAKTRR